MNSQLSARRLAFAAAAMLSILTLVPFAFAEGATVTIDNFTFDPPILTVNAGTTVTWLNRDDIPHTVVSTTKLFKSKALDTDDKFSFTFTTPGTYDYFCSLHPHMKAAVVVKANAGK